MSGKTRVVLTGAGGFIGHLRIRNSDHTLLRKVLGWEPLMSLEDGLAITDKWIDDQLEKKRARDKSVPLETCA